MANALDYIFWRGDLSFTVSPLNEVDLFLFTQLSMPDYADIFKRKEAVTLKELAARYFESHSEAVSNLGLLQSALVLPALKAAGEAPRYRDLIVREYVNKIKTEQGEQFSAITIEKPKKFCCVIFRGTDDTIIGWKEDFEMAAKEQVAAQQDARKYLTIAIGNTEAPKIYVCGHSKGGNLAVYSAVNVARKIQDRISMAISFDGPGFRDEFFETKGYAAMEKRLVSVLSENAFIGLLLRHAGKQYIVKTAAKGANAHDGFTWEVLGTKFVKKAKLSSASLKFNAGMDEALSRMNEEERLTFIDGVFELLFSTGAMTLTELSRQSLKTKADLILRISQDKTVTSYMKLIIESILLAKPAGE